MTTDIDDILKCGHSGSFRQSAIAVGFDANPEIDTDGRDTRLGWISDVSSSLVEYGFSFVPSVALVV